MPTPKSPAGRGGLFGAWCPPCPPIPYLVSPPCTKALLTSVLQVRGGLSGSARGGRRARGDPPHPTAPPRMSGPPGPSWGWGHCTAMNVPGGATPGPPTPHGPGGRGGGQDPPSLHVSIFQLWGPHPLYQASIPQYPPGPGQLSPPCPQSRAWGPSLSPSSHIPTGGVPHPWVPGSGTRTSPIHHLPHPKRCTPKQGHQQHQGHSMGLGGRVSPGECHPMSPCSLVPCPLGSLGCSFPWSHLSPLFPWSLVPWGHWDAHSPGPPVPMALRMSNVSPSGQGGGTCHPCPHSPTSPRAIHPTPPWST